MASFDPSKYVKPNVTKDDVLNLKKAFDLIDLNHNGAISPLEIRDFFQKTEIEDSKDVIYELLKEMDEDYSGNIEFEEFFNFLTSNFAEKEKREEIRKFIKKGVEIAKKQATAPAPASGKKEDPKKVVLKPQEETKKPVEKEEKAKESGVSREKHNKKESLRSKPKQKGETKAAKNEDEFDPEPYINVHVNKETVMDLKKAFDILDDDGSGTIVPNEIQKYFEKLGLMSKNKLIYQILAEMDEDKSGAIDFNEFIKFITARISDKNPSLRAEIEKIFAFFDANNNGKVSWTELKIVANFLGEEMSDDELKEMFLKADLDDDGFVTVDDFYNIWTGQGYY